MLKKFTKTAVLSALALVGTGVAYSAFTAPDSKAPRSVDAAVATWEMGVPLSEVSGTSSVSGINLSMSVGDVDIVVPNNKGATAAFDGVTYTTFMCKGLPCEPDEARSVKFTVTPDGSFTPENISFKIINQGFGDGRFTLVAKCGDAETTLASAVEPVRNNAAAGTSATQNYSISGITATAGQPFDVILYLHAKNEKHVATDRTFMLRDMVIAGTYEGGAEEPVEATYTIPGALALEANANLALDKCSFDNSNGIGYVENGATVTYTDLYASRAGAYKATIDVDYSYGDGTAKIEVFNAADNKLEAVYDGGLPRNASSFQTIDFPLDGKVTKGMKKVVFTFGRASGYVANLRNFTMEWTGEGTPLPGDGDEEPEVPADGRHIPGLLDINKNLANIVCSGPTVPRKEDKGPNGSANFGYIRNESKVVFNGITCAIPGVYTVELPFSYNAGGDVKIEVIDNATSKVEAEALHTFVKMDNEGAYPSRSILLGGFITEGTKSVAITFYNPAVVTSGWIGNCGAPTFVKTGDAYAAITSVAIEGVAAEEFEGFDYAFNLPIDYSSPKTTLNVASLGATVAASASVGEITDNGDGTFTVDTPAPNAETVVTFTLTPDNGAAYDKLEYRVRIYHIGDVMLGSLSVDGENVDAAVVEALNAEGATTISDRVYTALPKVSAIFVDGTAVEAEVSMSGSAATYTFTGKAGDKSRTFTLVIDGVHLFTPADTDETVEVRFDASCNQADGTWSNGLYTVVKTNDGWGGSQFKFKSNMTHELHVPADVVVKQFVLASLFDNYVPGEVTDVTTNEGASVYFPYCHSFKNGRENAYDLVVNIEGHKAGEPIRFTFKDGSQPVAWFRVVYAREALTTAPVLNSVAQTSTEHKNHAVVTLTFDREMTDVEATVNGTATVVAEGGSNSLRFPLWNLLWNGDNTMVIAKGAAKDRYGNANDEEIKVTLAVGNPAEVSPLESFTVVSTVEELRAAVAAVNASNKTADAPHAVIFVKNGDYDLGSEVLHIQKACNVSLIGESREGVLIHGERDGISNPIFSTRYSTNVYMQDFTLRNDLDFGKPRAGVAVCHYGGNRDIMVNVEMQSQQDTQVTGEQGYYLNCTIHGAVDYICGGGDHYYDHCTFIQTNPGAISAPSTSIYNKWGYVLQYCTIKGTGYNLGRPWQHEPRCYWLNTTMETPLTGIGWGSMGDLPTHFYEYNSMDINGNPIDLSKRGNSPTSTNSYKPVLTDAEAARFTLENVLGGSDSWLPTEQTAKVDAPRPTITDGMLTWSAVDGAAGYIVYLNGEFLGYTTDCSYETAGVASRATAEYTVASLNAMGAPGERSAIATPTAIESVEAAGLDAAAVYYNLQGVRVENPVAGLYIRVANGVTSKVLVK